VVLLSYSVVVLLVLLLVVVLLVLLVVVLVSCFLRQQATKDRVTTHTGSISRVSQSIVRTLCTLQHGMQMA
jgi:hypothetical protein